MGSLQVLLFQSILLAFSVGASVVPPDYTGSNSANLFIPINSQEAYAPSPIPISRPKSPDSFYGTLCPKFDTKLSHSDYYSRIIPSTKYNTVNDVNNFELLVETETGITIDNRIDTASIVTCTTLFALLILFVITFINSILSA
jgi:hypothetical protein